MLRWLRVYHHDAVPRRLGRTDIERKQIQPNIHLDKNNAFSEVCTLDMYNTHA